MHIPFLLAALSLLCAAWGEQPSAPSPVSSPLRELPWGQLNFLHTTDTHGWIAGHLREPSYSADWGDYVSFSQNLKKKAEQEGKDLLLIDTGDRIEGSGLYDASHPKGNFSREIFAQQDIDVICIGNHELYRKSSAENELLKVAPRFADNYISSNVDVKNPKNGERVPLAQRYKKFETKNQKIRITAFGFLFDFKQNSDNSFVQPVEETIAEDWFQEAIKDREVDLFLFAGHIPAHSEEFATLYKAVREKQWDAPVMFFGGHAHIRDYAIYDKKAHALASGRYLETIGFQSISGLSSGGETKHGGRAASSPSFSRMYIENNLWSYHHHTGLNSSEFPTEKGRNVSAMISSAREALDLDHRIGCAPQTLWMSRAEYPSEASLYSWLDSTVIPQMVVDPGRADKSRIVVVNTGAVRFDIFKGDVTTDTLYAVSPFANGFRYLRDVPFETADRILTVLNDGANMLKEISPNLDEHSLTPPEQIGWAQLNTASGSWTRRHHRTQATMQEKPNLTPGYTTRDDAGEDGDDTIHSPITYYKVPNCFESRTGIAEDDVEKRPDAVDLVFIEFIQPWVLAALKFLGSEYEEEDTMAYLEGRNVTGLISQWIEENWKGKC